MAQQLKIPKNATLKDLVNLYERYGDMPIELFITKFEKGSEFDFQGYIHQIYVWPEPNGNQVLVVKSQQSPKFYLTEQNEKLKSGER